MMDAIEKRARFEAWRKSKYPDQPIGPVRACGTYWRTGVQRDWEVWQKAIAALTPPEGHVVVTRNEAGQAVAVTRQDDEGRILSVIAVFGPTKGDMGNPTKEMMQAGGWNLSPVDQYKAMLAVRPEIGQ